MTSTEKSEFVSAQIISLICYLRIGSTPIVHLLILWQFNARALSANCHSVLLPDLLWIVNLGWLVTMFQQEHWNTFVFQFLYGHCETV